MPKTISEPTSASAMSRLSDDDKRILIAQRDVWLQATNLVDSSLLRGDFPTAKKAAKLCGRETEVADYEAAVKRNDTTTCGHGAYQRTIRIWTDKHADYVWVFQCAECGHLNATPQNLDQPGGDYAV